MSFFKKTIYLFFILLSQFAYAHQHDAVIPQVHEFIKEMFQDNAEYRANIALARYRAYGAKQTPVATVVMCSDSRVQSSIIKDDARNDLFVIRNIGNQVETAKGSVEYGVNHLNTPVLMIVGHSGCGAVEAAMKDFSQLSPSIRAELRSLDVKGVSSVDVGVVDNVGDQVEFAMKIFPDRVRENKLTVIGVVYDFRNDFKKGYGRLILVNINGERDPKKLAENSIVKGIGNISIGTGHL